MAKLQRRTPPRLTAAAAAFWAKPPPWNKKAKPRFEHFWEKSIFEVKISLYSNNFVVKIKKILMHSWIIQWSSIGIEFHDNRSSQLSYRVISSRFLDYTYHIIWSVGMKLRACLKPRSNRRRRVILASDRRRAKYWRCTPLTCSWAYLVVMTTRVVSSCI